MTARRSLETCTRPSRAGTHLVFTMLVVAIPAFGGLLKAEVQILPGDSAATRAARAHLSSVPGRAGSPLPAPLDRPGTTLHLPYFEVDATGFTDTTLIGLRNNSPASTAFVDVFYLDLREKVLQAEQGIAIPPLGTYTRNIRDVAGLPADPDGVKRGMVQIFATSSISGDVFNVDPTNDFATGGRLIADFDYCYSWDTRFVAGGAFSGGTRFQLYTTSPRGVGAGDPFTASLEILDEGGTSFGTVGIKTDQNTIVFDIRDVLAALPGGIGPTFGSAFVYFNDPTTLGALQVEFSAESRYSIQIPGSCERAP